MIPPIPSPLATGFTLTSLLGQVILDPSFKQAEAQGNRRQEVSREDGQSQFTYLGDQMNDVNEFPLHLQGFVNHATAQEHMDYLVDLYAKLKVCTSVVRPDSSYISTDAKASVKAYATRTPVADSDKFSQIDLYICVGLASFNIPLPPIITSYGSLPATRKADGRYTIEFPSNFLSLDPSVTRNASVTVFTQSWVFITREDGVLLGGVNFADLVLETGAAGVGVYLSPIYFIAGNERFTAKSFFPSQINLAAVDVKLIIAASVPDNSQDGKVRAIFISFDNYTGAAFTGVLPQWALIKPLKEVAQLPQNFNSSVEVQSHNVATYRYFYIVVGNAGPFTAFESFTGQTDIVAYELGNGGFLTSRFNNIEPQFISNLASMVNYTHPGDEVWLIAAHPSKYHD